MSLKVCFIMDPIEKITIAKDTTFAMMLEAKNRGWAIDYAQINDLYYQDRGVWIQSKSIHIDDNPARWFRFLSDKQSKLLIDYDVVIMRKDPPFNMNYIYATYLLEQAEKSGAWVVNRPSGLRDCNEKYITTYFPECCPPTLVSSIDSVIRSFVKEHQLCVLKPLDSMGGHQVFVVDVRDPNLSVMLEILTNEFNTAIMVQAYIPEIKKGDKRILIINGKPFPYALNRIPLKGETRGNLAAGAHAEGVKITERDEWICEQIAPYLLEKGLMFVGIDVIGEYLTEINVTSPTCAREIEKAFHASPSALFCDVLEEGLSLRSPTKLT